MPSRRVRPRSREAGRLQQAVDPAVAERAHAGAGRAVVAHHDHPPQVDREAVEGARRGVVELEAPVAVPDAGLKIVSYLGTRMSRVTRGAAAMRGTLASIVSSKVSAMRRNSFSRVSTTLTSSVCAKSFTDSRSSEGRVHRGQLQEAARVVHLETALSPPGRRAPPASRATMVMGRSCRSARLGEAGPWAPRRRRRRTRGSSSRGGPGARWARGSGRERATSRPGRRRAGRAGQREETHCEVAKAHHFLPWRRPATGHDRWLARPARAAPKATRRAGSPAPSRSGCAHHHAQVVAGHPVLRLVLGAIGHGHGQEVLEQRVVPAVGLASRRSAPA